MRRVVALLVICAGLLGVAGPALACASAALAGDCCPPGQTTGCGEQAPTERVEAPAIAVCCLSAPTSSPSVSVESARKTHVDQDDSSSEPSSIVSSFVASVALDVRSARGPPPADSFADARLTYLHTGRLRL
jgi:hypothetical protein